MDLVIILNQNSGLISAIATVILVLITAWYAYTTKRILKSNEKASKEQLRPFIIANLYSQDHLLKLAIMNVGLRPAKNVKISFNPPLDEIDKLSASSNNHTPHKQILDQAFMPPQFKVSTTLMFSEDFVKQNNLPRAFSAYLRYKDLECVEYEEEYALDLAGHVYAEKTVEYTDNYHFKKIESHLSEICQTLKKKQ